MKKKKPTQIVTLPFFTPTFICEKIEIGVTENGFKTHQAWVATSQFNFWRTKSLSSARTLTEGFHTPPPQKSIRKQLIFSNISEKTKTMLKRHHLISAPLVSPKRNHKSNDCFQTGFTNAPLFRQLKIKQLMPLVELFVFKAPQI